MLGISKFHGVKKEYSNNLLELEELYKDGELKNKKTFYKDGNLSSEVKYKDGKEENSKSFYEDGQLKSEIKYKDGITENSKEFFKDGKLKYEYQYFLDRSDLYTCNNLAKYIQDTIAELRARKYIRIYNENGQLIESANYKKGFYNPEKANTICVTPDDGVYKMPYMYTNMDGIYKNGKFTGIIDLREGFGDSAAILEYKNDILVSYKKYSRDNQNKPCLEYEDIFQDKQLVRTKKYNCNAQNNKLISDSPTKSNSTLDYKSKQYMNLSQRE